MVVKKQVIDIIVMSVIKRGGGDSMVGTREKWKD
jgi:hypothetical protein